MLQGALELVSGQPLPGSELRLGGGWKFPFTTYRGSEKQGPLHIPYWDYSVVVHIPYWDNIRIFYTFTNQPEPTLL